VKNITTLDVLLSFKEFSSHDDCPRYGNFVNHWIQNDFGEIYRKQDHAKRFQKEHPELDSKLWHGIGGLQRPEMRYLKQFEHDLYEAYKIMNSYGVTNTDLFS
jgi:hypothetical protein